MRLLGFVLALAGILAGRETVKCTCKCYSAGSENGACNVASGECPCLTNVLTFTLEKTEGARVCSQCQPNFYGIDSGNGCTACSCNDQGSSNLQCDDNGHCPCKDSVQGVKCDQCKPGFYGFGPNGCSACNCSEAGSTSSNCDQAKGKCTCKENVQGDKCDQCKSQMFNLASYNPKGCQPCFCFRHGQSCQSATGFTAQSITVSKQSPTTPLDLSELYGQRHTSYGTELSLGLSADFSLIIENEPLITLEGHGLKMYHLARPGTTIPRDSPLEYQVQVLEGEWKKDVDGTPSAITALELMELLSDLSKVTYLARSKGQDLTMTYLKVEYPGEISNLPAGDPVGPQVMYVEQCTCVSSASVAGLSCEECATGFKRPKKDGETKATSFDTCVQCDCNGRGATNPPECNALTGVCLNCRNGTTGDQCESCAGNVIGANCDTCKDEFWGLREDGCRACECSSPGSLLTICEKENGQCPCATNVEGRTCDRCKENYYGLTSQGCTKCDNCYSLLTEDVGGLREIRDVLAQNVSIIEERNRTNPSTKPFSVRFQETVDDTNKLISFLDSAEQSENEVKTQIEALDKSLLTIESQLTTMDNATLPQVDVDLVSAESAITKGKQYRTDLEVVAKDTKSKLETLGTSSQTLSDLVNDIKKVEDTLQGIADASSANTEILSQLDNLNETAYTSNELAKDILAKAQAALEVQKTTTNEILSLESEIISLETKAAKTSASATSLSTQSQETFDVTTKLQRNLAELTAFTVDFDGLKTRSDTASAVTTNRNNQLIRDQASYQDIKTKAEATVAVVNDLTSQSNVIGNKATEWITRSSKAEQQAQLFSQRTDFIFKETEATLALLNDFDNRAKAVEDQANAKLEQVSSVQALSQQLIEDSQTLTESLSSLQQMASNAKETSAQSKTVIQTKLTRIEGVERQATELKTQLDGLDAGGADRIQVIENTKTNVLKPGEKLCSDLNSNLATFNTELVATDTVTSDTLAKVGNTTEHATAILTELRGLEKVDANGAQVLFNQITVAQSNLKAEELTATINSLLQAKENQRKEIDSLKTKKDSLKEKIDNLNTLLQQIRPASP